MKNDKKNKIILYYFSFLFLLFITVSLWVLVPWSWQNIALALNGNYDKDAGDTLLPADWNYLDEDFLMKEGDTMTGDLNMGGNSITGLAQPTVTDLDYAATVQYANAMAGAGAKDRNGNPLNIVCGSTGAGLTDWENDAGGVYVDIYTTDDGLVTGSPNFLSFPMYFTSLGGTVDHELVYGAWGIYNFSIVGHPVPDNYGFRIKLETLVYNESDAETRQWHINWCGIGN